VENNCSDETYFATNTDLECFVEDIHNFCQQDVEVNKKLLVDYCKEHDFINSLRKFISVFDSGLE